MKSTIKDVARSAKVSVATVSRIVNGQPGYSEKTKQAVLEVVARLGYTPNAIARGLVKKTSSTIAILLPSLTGSFMAELLDGVVAAARQRDYNVIICNTGEDGRDMLKYLRVMGEQQVGGIIIASAEIKPEYVTAIFELKRPVVFVATFSDRHQIPYVKVDDQQAAYQATRYLIDRRHRHIGMLSGTQGDHISGTPRVRGFQLALEDAGLTFAPHQVTYGNFGFPSGLKACAQLIEQFSELTAIFAASDEMAVAALAYAYQHGIHVPRQLSVIGYDDTPLAQMVTPALTTVHQPIYDMGAKAVELLLERQAARECIIMPSWITERASVATLMN